MARWLPTGKLLPMLLYLVVIGSRIVGIVFGAAAGVRYNKLSVTRMCPGVAAAVLSGSGGCWLVMVDDFAPSLVLFVLFQLHHHRSSAVELVQMLLLNLLA